MKVSRFALLALLVPVLAFAGELNGVKMPDSTKAGDKDVVLNGMGLRKKFIFKVYVAGLYLENKASDASTVLKTDQTRRVVMHMLRNLDRKTMAEAIQSGFEKNNKDQMPKLKDRLDNLLKDLPDELKEGDDVVITYYPAKGTKLEVKGKDSTVVEGKDFADAMFSVWLGSSPVDESLKNGMLGKAE
ncbi:MAG: chalcone isomerase family protein [Myxococcaceae bacterium]